MGEVSKVTVSLPTDLLVLAQRLQNERGATRSALVREALERFIREEQEREAVERYVRGYLEHPEEGDEIEVWDQLGAEALASEPWE